MEYDGPANDPYEAGAGIYRPQEGQRGDLIDSGERAYPQPDNGDISTDRPREAKDSEQAFDARDERTDIEREAVDHYVARSLKTLDKIDAHAERGLRVAEALPEDSKQELLDVVEDLRIDGALARERVARLAQAVGDADIVIAQAVATYESLRIRAEDAKLHIDELTAGTSDEPPGASAASTWFRKLASLLKGLLGGLASMLAAMMRPKEWVLKGEVGWLLAKGQIEIKFGR